MPIEPPKYTLTYFQRDQLAFFVTHQDQDKPKDEQIDALLNHSNTILGKKGLQASLKFRSSFSFPKVSKLDYVSKLDPKRQPSVNKEQPPSSLISATITDASDDQMEFLQLATELDTEVRKAQLSGLTVEAVSVDWLASSSPDGNGTGGPGGWPAPYRGSPERAPFRFNELPETVMDGNRGEGVDVIILDTAITEEDKASAYNEWRYRHPLIHSLLRPDGPLHIIPLPGPQKQHIAGLRTLGHDYKMTDHGLFVAGIIHTIAPCAQIYLVEVLNQFGVGDTESIGWGFEFATQLIQKDSRGKVVNASFCSVLPAAEPHCYTIPVTDNCFPDLFTEWDRKLEEKICDQMKKNEDWFNDQKLALEVPCDTILSLKSRVIAAAGNDRRPRQNVAPQARYPAAFDSVQGVGALPRDLPKRNGKFVTASYSNKADDPRDIGITTLGGEEGEGQGVLGLYLGEFPCEEPNCTKWAWWSGTSFATPVFTGITAATLSDIPNSHTQEAIDKLYNENKVVKDGAENTEDSLSLPQG